MSFTGNEGQQVTLEEGGQYTARHRAANPDAVKGVFFGKNHIEKILAQGDCKGLRLYFAENADGSKTLVMVGADSLEDDMLDFVFEMATPCPPKCGKKNALNSSDSSR